MRNIWMHVNNRLTGAVSLTLAATVILFSGGVFYPFAAPAAVDADAPFVRDNAPDIQALLKEVKQHRRLLRKRPKNEVLRGRMAEIAILLGKEVEYAESLNDGETAARLAGIITAELSDTLWRIGYLARNGGAGAQTIKGMFHRRGVLIEVNQDEACRYYKMAGDQGQAVASYRYGLCLAKSKPLSSIQYLRHAAEGGHAAAQELMGRRCLRHDDLSCAREYLCRSARQGRPSAASLLAWLYASGKGGGKEARKAFFLYSFAAAKGDVTAQSNLGGMFETGAVGHVDYRRAADLYLQAARAGFGPAQFNLGRLYIENRELGQGENAAGYWLEKAAAQGIEEAKKLLR